MSNPLYQVLPELPFYHPLYKVLFLLSGWKRPAAELKYQDVVSKIKDLNRIKEALYALIDSCSGPKGDCPILEALEGDDKTGDNPEE